MNVVQNLTLPALAMLVGVAGFQVDGSAATQQDSFAQVEEFTDRYERMFAPKEPMVGTTIKDLSGFDEAGKEFGLKATRGKHTVLVFGCLT